MTWFGRTSLLPAPVPDLRTKLVHFVARQRMLNEFQARHGFRSGAMPSVPMSVVLELEQMLADCQMPIDP